MKLKFFALSLFMVAGFFFFKSKKRNNFYF